MLQRVVGVCFDVTVVFGCVFVSVCLCLGGWSRSRFRYLCLLFFRYVGLFVVCSFSFSVSVSSSFCICFFFRFRFLFVVFGCVCLFAHLIACFSDSGSRTAGEVYGIAGCGMVCMVLNFISRGGVFSFSFVFVCVVVLFWFQPV